MKFQTTTAAPELFATAPKLRDRQQPPPPPSPSGRRWVQQQQQRRGLRLHVWRSCIHCQPISLCQMVKLSSLGAQKRESDAGIGTHSLFKVALENLHFKTYVIDRPHPNPRQLGLLLRPPTSSSSTRSSSRCSELPLKLPSSPSPATRPPLVPPQQLSARRLGPVRPVGGGLGPRAASFTERDS